MLYSRNTRVKILTHPRRQFFYMCIFCIVYIISVIYNEHGSITVDTTHSSTVIT